MVKPDLSAPRGSVLARQRQVRKLSRWLSLQSGLILALCFLLPAARGCEGQPFYPYQEFPHLSPKILFAAPYLFGLLAAVAAGFLFGGRNLAAGTEPGSPYYTAYWAFTLLISPSFLYFTATLILTGSPLERQICMLLLPAGLFLIYKLARSKKQTPDKPAWAGRVTWTGSGLSALWFIFWILSVDTLYGLWISLCVTVLLFFGGALAEVRLADPERTPS